MPSFEPCGPPSQPSLYRAVAVLLWLVPAFRAASPLEAAFAFGLGGCLWWVAQRQTSQEAALLAAGFFAVLPPAHPVAPLCIFAMLYTATGVAHALQGPRRKWLPRIGLMTGATLFTAVVDPLACAAALLLGGALSLWLAESRRAVLFGCLTAWIVLATGCTVLRPHVPFLAGLPRFSAEPSLFRLPPLFQLGSGVPFALALSLGLAFYVARPRSRFYGHTAPLLCAVPLAAVSLAWAFPFALLFLAGLAADMLQSRRGKAWRGCLWLLLALQAASAVVQAGAARRSFPRVPHNVAQTLPRTHFSRPIYRSFLHG